MTDTLIIYILSLITIYGWYWLFDYEVTDTGKYDTRNSMIFGYIAYILDKRIGLPYTKPLYNCLPCMALIYGSIIYLILLPDINIIIWILSLSGGLKLASKL